MHSHSRPHCALMKTDVLMAHAAARSLAETAVYTSACLRSLHAQGVTVGSALDVRIRICLACYLAERAMTMITWPVGLWMP